MKIRAIAVIVAAGLAVVLFAGVAVIGAFMGATTDDSSGCGAPDQGVTPVDLAPGVRNLTAAQLSNAGVVIAQGRRMRVPARGVLIALAVASQESRFTNYANDGAGGDLAIDQLGIEQSLQLPHEAVGTDHGSLGIFQQQWPWWGTMSQLMDPAASAKRFYAALTRVRGWQSMPLTVAAQRVQRSAYPDAYADDEAVARQLLGGAGAGGDSLATDAAWGASGSTGADCVSTVAAGDVVFPLPASASYRDNHNWGSHGSHWARMHTGTDLSVACGTPVLAATAGTVVIQHDQSWAGPSLVQVSSGIGQLTTWYAHMRAVTVAAGETVTAGQQIGEVGDLGNATGCHLHFEVHPKGGSIYQDSVDPSPWLRAQVGRPQDVMAVPVSSSSSDPDWFTVATFNTLGSSHTGRGGNKKGWASGPVRTRGVVQLLEKYGVDVVGLQEFQSPQRRAFLALAGASYATWSPSGDPENSIAWRRARFVLVSATTLSVPYFNGHPRRMPVVRLRDLTTGTTTTFLNVHNPADTARYRNQGRWRRLAVARETALVRRLAARGPVVITGDMNDRRDVYCGFTAVGLTSSANGEVSEGGCHVPAHPEIDWVFGSRRVKFSDYTRELSALVRRTTDHPFIVARAHAG